jgi:hypothetical protein
MISIGESDTGLFIWRPLTRADPDRSVDQLLAEHLDGDHPVGRHVFMQGSLPNMPMGQRPSFAALYGFGGSSLFGQGVVPTLDDLASLYPTDAALTAFIQSGFGGAIPRPEFAVDDTGAPGYLLKALIYYCRRQPLSGSYPRQHPPIFGYVQGRAGFVMPGQSISLDFADPVITVQSGYPARVNNTSIRVRWTTNVPTIGFVVAGTPNSQGPAYNRVTYPYSVWSPLESGFSANHDITLSGIPDVTGSGNSPTHVAVMSFKKSGIAYQISRDFAVS